MTFKSQRLGDTIRFQRGQVGVLKSQEIVKIVVRWGGRGMMTQSVDRGGRRWVNGSCLLCFSTFFQNLSPVELRIRLRVIWPQI